MGYTKKNKLLDSANICQKSLFVAIYVFFEWNQSTSISLLVMVIITIIKLYDYGYFSTIITIII